MPNPLDKSTIDLIKDIAHPAVRWLNQHEAQTCTSAGNTETGSPKTDASAGRVWVISPDNNMPVQAFNTKAFDFTVGAWVLVAEDRYSGDLYVTELLAAANAHKGGDTYNSLIAQGPVSSNGFPHHNYTALANPTVSDDETQGYHRLSQWINTTTSVIFECTNPAAGAAVWKQISSGFTLAGDTGSSTVDNGDTLTVAGAAGLDTSVASDTVTITPDFTEFTSDDTFVGTDELVYLTGSTHKRGTVTGLFTAPTLTDFTNANHDHLDADDGGTLSAAAIASGTLTAGRAVAEVTTTSTGNIDDFAIGTAPITLLRMNNASSATLRGMAAGVGGQIVIIASIGAGNVFLAHQNAGSSAANQLNNTGFVTSVDLPLKTAVGRAVYQYDDTTDRWRLINHVQGGFIAYTPTWSSTGTAPSLGNGTLTGDYLIRGTAVTVKIGLTAGSTTTFGTGTWTFSVPITLVGSGTSGAGFGYDNGVSFYSATTLFFSGTTIIILAASTNAAFTNTTPFTWGNTDQVGVSFEYEG